MKHLSTLLLLLGISVLSFSQVVTPRVLNSGGGLLETENLALSYSIGETFIATFTDNVPTFSQGFEQPDSVLNLEIVEVNGFDSEQLKLRIFPNPTTDWLVVEYSGPQQMLQASIWAISGQVLIPNFQLEANTRNLINLNSTAPGALFIRLEDEQQNFAVFKFLKISK